MPSRALTVLLLMLLAAGPAAGQGVRGDPMPLAAGVAPPPPPDVFVMPATNEDGYWRPPAEAALPAPARAGDVPAITDAIGPADRRRLRPPEDDPFAAPGRRVGAFVLRGRLDVNAGHDSNPRRVRGGEGSRYGTVAGEVSLESDWVRHQLDLRAEGSYTRYQDIDGFDAPLGDVSARGRADITREVNADIEAGVAFGTLEAGAPDTPTALANRPVTTDLRLAAGVTYNPQPWSVRIGGRVERSLIEDGRLQNGGVYDTGDRVSTRYAVEARSTYDLSPRLAVFSDATLDRRIHDRKIDDSGFRRDSTGFTTAVGVRAEVTPLMEVEARIGYGHRHYEDAALKDLDGLLADASLTWTVTPLTTVRASIGTTFGETTLAGVSGSVMHNARFEVTHALRRNLAVTGAVEAARTDYRGANQTDDLLSGELGVDWRLGRHIGLRARAAHARLTSTVPGQDYTATLFEAGLRFRY